MNDAVLAADAALELADFVEFRADYFRDLKEADIQHLAGYPAILTIRSPQEGGCRRISSDEKIRLYRAAIEKNMPFIDVELSENIATNLVEFRDEIGSNSKIIISHHDFSGTPSFNTLVDIVGNELEVGDFGKVSTMVNTKGDILNILNAALAFEGRVIAVGMGEKGALARILATYFGSIFTFASMGGKSSAPGQIDVVTLKEYWRVLDTAFCIK